MGWNAFGVSPAMALQAATPVGGFALQNGTPTIISWTAPNDGNYHRALILAILDVSVAETGGAIGFNFTDPIGTVLNGSNIIGAGKGVGVNPPNPGVNAVMMAPNTTLAVVQSTALTLGASKLFAEIWGL